jgi:hypothetical protein
VTTPSAPAVAAAPATPVATSGGRLSSASRPTTAQPVQAVKSATVAKEPAKEKDKERAGKSKAAPAPVAGAEETLPTKAPTKTPATTSRGTPVWTYVAVGFVFGLVLLGVYRMVVLFSN